MKSWACAMALGACLLAGCHEDPTGVSTTPAGVSNGSGTATLSWEAPTTDTDGAPLMNLAGYRIYYGTSSGDLSQSVQLTGTGLQTYMIDNLGAGTWYFAVQAFTSAGAQSALSQMVSKTIG